MTDLEITEVIKKLISDEFGIPLEDIEEESFLDEDLGISDLDLEDLAENIKNKYDVEIPQEKLTSFKKVGDIIAYVYENFESPV